MKQYYIVKVKKGSERNLEKVLLMCLVDRMNLCSIVKSVELKSDTNNVYFVLGGERFSCNRVLTITRKILSQSGVYIKIYDYNAMRSPMLDDLVWEVNSNECGRTIKSYYKNPIMFNYIKKLTTKFVLKKGLLSNHVFCPECDGFADAVELNSLKGIYKCSFCDADIVVEGPILTGKKVISHLSTEEQLYLIGKPNSASIDLYIPDKKINGEQIRFIDDLELKEDAVQRIKRRRRTIFCCTSDSRLNFEQISWNITV